MHKQTGEQIDDEQTTLTYVEVVGNHGLLISALLTLLLVHACLS